MSVSVQDRQRVASAVEEALAELSGPRALALDDALRMSELACRKAAGMALPIVFAVADSAGGLILVHRMDGALPASLDIAINKAFTAAAFRMPTHELGEQAQPGRPLYGIEATNQGRVVLFGGGYPCFRNGAPVGALGVSGGTAAQDMEIASQVMRGFFDDTELGSEGGRSHE